MGAALDIPASAEGAKHRTVGGRSPRYSGERRRREAQDFRWAQPSIFRPESLPARPGSSNLVLAGKPGWLPAMHLGMESFAQAGPLPSSAAASAPLDAGERHALMARTLALLFGAGASLSLLLFLALPHPEANVPGMLATIGVTFAVTAWAALRGDRLSDSAFAWLVACGTVLITSGSTSAASRPPRTRSSICGSSSTPVTSSAGSPRRDSWPWPSPATASC